MMGQANYKIQNSCHRPVATEPQITGPKQCDNCNRAGSSTLYIYMKNHKASADNTKRQLERLKKARVARKTCSHKYLSAMSRVRGSFWLRKGLCNAEGIHINRLPQIHSSVCAQMNISNQSTSVTKTRSVRKNSVGQDTSTCRGLDYRL